MYHDRALEEDIKAIKHELLTNLSKLKLFYNLLKWINDETNLAIHCAKISLHKDDPQYAHLKKVLNSIKEKHNNLKERLDIINQYKRKDTSYFLLSLFGLLIDLLEFCNKTHGK